MSWLVFSRTSSFVVLALALSSMAEARQSSDPFATGSVSVDFGVGTQSEIWNLNGRHEGLIEATAAFWGAIQDGFCLGVTFNHLRIFQDTPGAFVQGFSPMIRWRFIQRGSWSAYAETGPGISWSDLPTPPRGTKFNYLFQGAGGVMRSLGANSYAVIGARFLHLSNNHREGRTNNPDLEMLGPFIALLFSF